jgi:tetratricopeptide (TPR) repeat protein
MKMLSALLLATVLIFAFSSVQAQKAKSSALDNDSREGLEAAKAGDLDKAIESFKRAAAAKPNDKTINYNLGLAHRQRALAYMKGEDWDSAIADFTEALKLIENDIGARRGRAFAYQRKGDLKNALVDYDAALKEKKNDPETLGRRAFLHMQSKDYDKAIADYSAVIKQKPKDVDAYLGRSYIYELTSKFDPGLADVDAVLKIQPTNSDALNRKARLEALKKGEPPPGTTPVIAGTPIPRAPVPPAPKPSPAAPAAAPSP